MYKTERNFDIFTRILSGKSLRTVGSYYQLTHGRIREIAISTYLKICKEEGIRPIGWTLSEIRQDEKFKTKVIVNNHYVIINRNKIDLKD